jgi:hypothetical protein
MQLCLLYQIAQNVIQNILYGKFPAIARNRVARFALLLMI